MALEHEPVINCQQGVGVSEWGDPRLVHAVTDDILRIVVIVIIPESALEFLYTSVVLI